MDNPDFELLGESSPDLKKYLRPATSTSYSKTIDFKNPEAVQALSAAFLMHHFGVHGWKVPPDRLCPPVPNRYKYLHWVQEVLLLGRGNRGSNIRGVDIGTGASCIYPIIGAKAFGWDWIASEIDVASHSSAVRNVTAAGLEGKIDVRLVSCNSSESGPLAMALAAGGPIDTVDFTVTNPPFFASRAEAVGNPHTCCTGAEVEMFTSGGECAFVGAIVNDSVKLQHRIQWFTAMLGRKSSLRFVLKRLREISPCPTAVLSAVLDTTGFTRRWVIGWSFTVVRNPSQIEKALKKPSKHKVEENSIIFEVPAKRPAEDCQSGDEKRTRHVCLLIKKHHSRFTDVTL